MHAPELYESNKEIAWRDMNEAIPVLLKVMGSWKHEELILDYGCGAGSTGKKFFLPLANASDSLIHGVDISEEMIATARKDSPSVRVQYFEGNILDNDFTLLENNKYDKIFSIHVFQFIKDYKGAMKRFYDILKPGGTFGFILAICSPHFSLWRILGEDSKFKETMKGYEEFVPTWFEEEETPEYGKKCFDTLAREVGFEILHSKIHYQRNEVDRDTLTGFYVSLNPIVKRVPDERMNEFFEAHEEANCKLHNINRNSKRVVWEHQLLSVVLRKPT